MKIKTSELTGPALRWAVATLDGYTNLRRNPHRFADPDELVMDPPRVEYGAVSFSERCYSTDWSQGGPIIDRHDICIIDKLDLETWVAQLARARTRDGSDNFRRYYRQTGPTKLIAAMRCFVASKLGDEVDVPDELCEEMK